MICNAMLFWYCDPCWVSRGALDVAISRNSVYVSGCPDACKQKLGFVGVLI